MKWLVLVVSVYALVAAAAGAAAVPRDLNNTTATNTTKNEATAPIICAHYTPCAWEIYTPDSRRPQTFIVNSYCICSEDTSCQEFKDDKDVFSMIYRCLPNTTTPPPTESESTNS